MTDALALLTTGRAAPLVLVAAGLLVGWLVALAGAVAATRPRTAGPAPATADLPDDLPPAVVAMLTQGWTVTEDAAEATLVDLAARGHIEFRQPAADARQTTIHLTPERAGCTARTGPADLTRYERRVLQRVESAARGGIVPVAALRARGGDHVEAWWTQFRSEVVADARSRGLSRPRAAATLVTALVAAAGLPAAAVGAVVVALSRPDDPFGAFVAGGLVAWVAAGALVRAGLRGDRDTPAGRTAATRWLGVQAFLRGDDAFAAQPPAAVAVWDRYLAYGDALGVTHVVREVLDLGTADRRRVWSAYGGTWRVVRVRYPRGGPAGRTVPGVVGLALLRVLAALPVLAVYAVLGGIDSRTRADLPALGPVGGATWAGALRVVAGAGGAALVLRVLYLVVRGFADLVTARSVTGEVLWVALWRSTSGGDDSPPRPVCHYLAVDEGTSDRTTAWALPAEWEGRCRPGDEVRITVRPWSRRVVALEPARQHPPELAPVAPGSAPTAVAGAAATNPLGLGALIGMPTPATTSDGDRLLVLSGMLGRVAWAAAGADGSARSLPGIADEAFVGGGWAVARRGTAVVQLALIDPALPDAEVAQRLARALAADPTRQG